MYIHCTKRESSGVVCPSLPTALCLRHLVLAPVPLAVQNSLDLILHQIQSDFQEPRKKGKCPATVSEGVCHLGPSTLLWLPGTLQPVAPRHRAPPGFLKPGSGNSGISQRQGLTQKGRRKHNKPRPVCNTQQETVFPHNCNIEDGRYS